MADAIPLPVTALYAGILGLLYLALAARIPPMRYRKRIGIGDGGDPELARAIRVHANFVETVPIALVLIAVVEANGLAAPWLHVLGGLLTVGRVSHAVGLNRTTGASLPRLVGMATAWGVVLLAALAALAQVLGLI